MAFPAIAGQQAPLSDEASKINYSVGYQIGSDFRFQDIEIRPKAVIQGIRDALHENQSQMSAAEMKQVMAELGRSLAEKKKQLRASQFQLLLEKSNRFHAENRAKPDVITTDSGLQYRMIEKGYGTNHPDNNDKVLVHYTGKLLNGQVFDSSFDRGKPASFHVNGVIKGWTEALQLMKKGDRWQLFIPPALAYGEKGAPPRIPPNSTLVFDLQLIAIQTE
ncbi:MAG: FKBP-type peptidyl-prolyl cis-trans isomerase [Candidatus Thiodiazotropha lotti]|nr:FKBP-type peptidyl-prolyl cis-trans isomerase [Candidatus Thiodiazotropha lotti]MCW4222586.1 FKBP-type peptidyl-prolyl cis-trans isomerase [Candidatus Thiodiazotropha lotti]